MTTGRGINTKYETKRNFILAWFRDNGGHNARADILNADFVDAYAARTGAPVHLMPFGAHKCPDLSRTLTRMHFERDLERVTVGLPGDSALGFPRWIYSYRLRNGEL